jgi:hypothetical protein
MGIWGIMKGSWIAFALSGIDQGSSMIHVLQTDCFVMTGSDQIAFCSRIASPLLAADANGTGFLNGWKMH